MSGIKISSRTRLSSRESGSYYRHERARSGSPSEFYRSQNVRKDTLYDRVHSINTFIHLGIEKFLDKQAVRDLIFEYDNDDIFIDGEEMFYANFARELSERELGHFTQRNKRFLEVADRVTAEKHGDYPQRDLMDLLPSEEQLKAQFDGNGNKYLGGGGGGGGYKPFSKPRASLWNSFFTAVRIKIFNVQHRAKSALRSTMITAAISGGGGGDGSTPKREKRQKNSNFNSSFKQQRIERSDSEFFERFP